MGDHEIANLLALSSGKMPPGLGARMVELNGLWSVVYKMDGKVVGVMSFGGDCIKIDMNSNYYPISD